MQFRDPPAAVCKPACDTIRSLDYYTEQKEWSQEAMAKDGTGWSKALIVKAGPLKQVQRALSVLGPAQPAPFGSTEILMEAVSPQFTVHNPKATALFVTTDLGLVELKCVIEGSLHVFGVALDACPGETTKEKHVSLSNMTMEQFKSLVEKEGFWAKMEENTMLAIPPRFAVITMNNDDQVTTHGLRWLVAGDDNCMKRSIKVLESAIADFPQLGQGSHGAVLRALKHKVD